jgi:serine/threonine protein phosphatase PrpC
VEQAGSDSHAITKAVGAQRRLELEVRRDEVRPGDRFLLCSDGLTRVLPDAQIGAALDGQEPAAAVQLLIQATLDGGAPDNVTALLVEATAEAVAKET